MARGTRGTQIAVVDPILSIKDGTHDATIALLGRRASVPDLIDRASAVTFKRDSDGNAPRLDQVRFTRLL